MDQSNQNKSAYPYSVTFGTGQSISFPHQPTPQQIQEAADQMGIKNQPTTNTSGIGQSILNGAKNFASNIISAPATLAARPGELVGEGIAGLASKVTGNPDYYNRAQNAANTPDSLFGGAIHLKPVNQETPESIAGEAASTIALGTPGYGSLSVPVTGALTSALGAAGSSMQNNDTTGQVLTNSAVGGLLGYGTGVLSQGLLNHVNAPHTMEDYLVQSGVADTNTAPKIVAAYNAVGINDLSSKEAVINAQNTLARNIQQANEYLTTNGGTDSVSGLLNDAAQRWTSRLQALQNLNQLLPGVGKYVNAVTPNLLRHGLIGATSALTGAGLLTNAIPQAASYLKDKFVGQLPNFVQ